MIHGHRAGVTASLRLSRRGDASLMQAVLQVAVAAAWRGRGGERPLRRAASSWLAWMCSIQPRPRNGASVCARGQRAFAAPVPSHPKHLSPSPGSKVSAAHGRALGPPGSPPLPQLRQSAYPVCVGRRGTAWGYMGPGARPGPWHAPFAPGRFQNSRGGESDRAPARPCCALRSNLLLAPPSPRTGGEERPGDQVATARVLECSRGGPYRLWKPGRGLVQPCCSLPNMPRGGRTERRTLVRWEGHWAGSGLTRDGRTVQQPRSADESPVRKLAPLCLDPEVPRRPYRSCGDGWGGI